MRKSQLSVAISAALLTGAQGAFAYDVNTVPDLDIYLSGASAQDKGLDYMFSNVLQLSTASGAQAMYKTCDSGTTGACTVTPIGGTSPTAGRNQTVWTFLLDKTTIPNLTITGTGDANGNPIVRIHKLSSGGSITGLGPLLGSAPSYTPYTVPYMVVSAANCTPLCAQPVLSGGVWTNANNHTSDFGVADVNAELFKGVNYAATNVVTVAPPTGQVNTLLNEKEAASVVFGIVVNNHLYNALQDAQIASGAIVPPAVGCDHAAQTGGTNGYVARDAGGNVIAGQTGKVGGYGQAGTLESQQACMPSLTKAQVTALMAGNTTDWSQVKVEDGAVLNTLMNYDAKDAAGNWMSGGVGGTPTTPPPGSPVVHCTRSAGSGTKADANFVFLNAPCTANALAPSSNWGLNTQWVGPKVMQMSSGGGVESCMQDADTKPAVVTAVDINNHALSTNGIAGGAGRYAWAFGIQSSENNASLAFPYRFVKIDGVAPTIKNVAEGKYINWAEQAYQWRKDYNTVGGWNPEAGTTDAAAKLAILTEIANKTAKKDTVANLNTGFLHPFGQSGLLGNAVDNTQQLPFADNWPVNAFTHKNASGLDNCRAPFHVSTDPAWKL